MAALVTAGRMIQPSRALIAKSTKAKITVRRCDMQNFIDPPNEEKTKMARVFCGECRVAPSICKLRLQPGSQVCEFTRLPVNCQLFHEKGEERERISKGQLFSGCGALQRGAPRMIGVIAPQAK
jgi:hypothetical protein